MKKQNVYISHFIQRFKLQHCHYFLLVFVYLWKEPLATLAVSTCCGLHARLG